MSALPPKQQSLAGGIFNTVTKVCSAVGLGISASIYNAESTSTAALQTTLRPYTSVFWFCSAAAGVGLLFVPFLTIVTQGHTTRRNSVTSLNGPDENAVKLDVITPGKVDGRDDTAEKLVLIEVGNEGRAVS